jgi:hypothetical protein
VAITQGAGGGAADFLRCRSKLPARPWFVDDFAAIQQRFADSTIAPYKKAILFVGKDLSAARALMCIVKQAIH